MVSGAVHTPVRTGPGSGRLAEGAGQGALVGVAQAPQREVEHAGHHQAVATGRADPRMLVMDQKVTTQKVLGALNARGVKFLPLRMRAPTLLRYINGLTHYNLATSPLFAAVTLAFLDQQPS
jgi:hypothetical protein